MLESLKLNRSRREAHMEIDGHQITTSFSDEYNPTLAGLVKETLIDSFLRKSGICSDDISVNFVFEYRYNKNYKKKSLYDIM